MSAFDGALAAIAKIAFSKAVRSTDIVSPNLLNSIVHLHDNRIEVLSVDLDIL